MTLWRLGQPWFAQRRQIFGRFDPSNSRNKMIPVAIPMVAFVPIFSLPAIKRHLSLS